MKRITGGGSRGSGCKKFFGKCRMIRKTEYVPSAIGHSRLPLGRIVPVDRIESFISVKCVSDYPKAEIVL
jgi:hypothetical protein